MTTDRDSKRIDAELRRIERSVLDELHLGKRRPTLAMIGTLMTVSLVFAADSVLDAAGTSNQHCVLAFAGVWLGGGAVTLTAIGLVRPRFRLCLAAAAAALFATAVLTIGFWTVHTGPAAITGTSLIVAAGCSAIVGLTWAGVLLSPLSASHPDCRLAPNHALHADDRSTHGRR